MELVEFTLKAGNRLLLDKVNIQLDKHVINHVMGSNGVGKSTFAKACVKMRKYEGKIKGNDSAILIGSGSNVPAEFSIADIVKLLKKRFESVRVDNLFELLKLSQVPGNLAIKKMSDGQKQKIKLLAFLSANPKVIILDEFTKQIAAQIVNLQCVIDPQRVAIGGGISAQPLLLEYIRKNVDSFSDNFGNYKPGVQVVPCTFRNDSNLIGALYHYLTYTA